MKRRPIRIVPLTRPFVKWAGGKRSLLPELLARAPKSFGTYHEPFVGGGALFFALRPLHPTSGYELGDMNAELVNAYRTIRDKVEELIEELSRSRYRNNQAAYSRVRAWQPESDVARTARFLYLNRTCFNGLYRLNRNGGFNVPFGRYEDPLICDEDNLCAVSQNLADVSVMCQGFESVLARAKKGDFVYFDPPYMPRTTTSNFDRYTSAGFGLAQHEHLRDVARELKSRGVSVMLSNSDVPAVRELYAKGFLVEEVSGARSVAANAKKRGAVADLLIR